MNAAFMRLERGWNDMNAAFMPYEESARAGVGGHGRARETLRHHRHRRPLSTPVQGQNKLSDIALEQL
jgi:hypothetical protein